jgi:uncharacterized protein (TIGR02001 family)
LHFILKGKIMRKSLLLVAVLGTLATSTAVMAEEAATPAAATPTWTFPSSVSVVSDYIWRGQSQTWGNPAVQAGIEADHVSGAYVGFWGSNVSSNWLPNASVEMDFSAGFRNTIATDFKYDVGGVYIYYPDGDFSKAGNAVLFGNGKSKLNSLELYGSLGWKWFTVKGGYMPTKFYGWNKENSGPINVGNNNSSAGDFTGDPKAGVTGNTNGSYYYMASASYDVPAVAGLNVAAEIGHQTIAESTGLDWTWYKVGVTKTFADTWAVNGFYTATTGSSAYEKFGSFANTSTSNVDTSKFVVGITKSF